MAVPFMPGIEMGIMIMMMFGRPGILLVYLCTLLALTLSFLAGRHLPPRILARVFDWFHLDRARDLVMDLAPLGSEKRLHLLLEVLRPGSSLSSFVTATSSSPSF